MPPLIVDNPRALKEFVGKEIGLSEWFRVSQERIGTFADAAEDRQWIHLDRSRAANESPYGATIAHGFLTLSLMGRFIEELIQIRGGVRLAVNYGLNRVRFPLRFGQVPGFARVFPSSLLKSSLIQRKPHLR